MYAFVAGLEIIRLQDSGFRCNPAAAMGVRVGYTRLRDPSGNLLSCRRIKEEMAL